MLEKAPSTGKTVIVSGSVVIALQNLIYTVPHDVWDLVWMTQQMASDIMVVAVAVTGWIMHTAQRQTEAGLGTNGGPPAAAP